MNNEINVEANGGMNKSTDMNKENSVMNIKMISTKELRQHPMSLEIYGEAESVEDIIESVRQHGIISPIAVKGDGTILSGHRRYRAACEVGMAEVPCYVVADFETEEEEHVFIVEANKARVKTASQMLKEGMKLQEAFEALAKKNKAANIKSGMAAYMTNGDVEKKKRHLTRIAVADALKIKESYWQFLVYLDKYAKIGNETAIDALKRLDKGEITINKAVTMVRASLKSGAAKGAGAEGAAAEPTFLESCRAEAVKQVRALTTVLQNVINAPDEDFNSVPWMTVMDDLYHIQTCTKRLSEKMSRKTRQAVRDMESAA